MPSDRTCSHACYFYFVKGVKPKSMVTQNNSITFCDLSQFIPICLLHISKKLPCLIKNDFQPLFKLRLTAPLFQQFLAKRIHIVNRAGIRMTSFGLYLDPVIIKVNLPPPIFNWSWHHPVRIIHPVSFLVNYTLAPPIFRWPWSHPVTLQFLKLHSKINPHQKFSREIILFLSIDYSSSPKKIFSSRFQIIVVETFYG